MKRKLFVSIIVTILFLNFSAGTWAGKEDIKVKVDGKELVLDVAPLVKNGRILVPFRAILESLGVKDIGWKKEVQEISGSLGKTNIRLTIGSDIGQVNNKNVYLDVPPLAVNGRSLIPLRFISENLGYNVSWDNETRTAHIRSEKYTNLISNNKLGLDLKMGQALDQLIKTMGRPDRIDKSSKYYDWYIYNKSLDNYIQVGVADNRIVAFATNASTWTLNNDLKIGSSREQVRKKYGQDIIDRKLIRGDHVTFLWDSHSNHIISTLIVEEKNLRCQSSDRDVANDFALQAFDLTNVYRIRNGLKPLKWNTKLEELALYHSKDMAEKSYFNHVSLNGDTLKARAEKLIGIGNGIGENIFKGATSALEAMNGFYNSEGHRKNLLHPSYEYLGVGVYFDNNPQDAYKKMLLTQNFQLGK